MANYLTEGLVPPATRLPLNGRDGIIQDFVPLKRDLLNLGQMVKKNELTEKQIVQLVIHLLTDWILSNYDTHALNFGIDHNGNIIAFDKGQAYKFVRGENFKSPYANRYDEPRTFSLEVYRRTWHNSIYGIFFRQKMLLSQSIDPNHPQLMEVLERIASLEKQKIAEWMGEFASIVYGDNANQLIDEIYYRTHGIRAHFRNFMLTEMERDS